MITDVHFTKTERRILKVLSDGASHPRQQLIDCIPHGQGTAGNVNDILSRMRKKLRPKGQTVICEYVRRQVHYRHVILLPPSDY